jgi:hypothetical protein
LSLPFVLLTFWPARGSAVMRFQVYQDEEYLTMFDTYCNICQEDGNLVPATIEYCVQREEDPEATHYVRCCSRHQEQGKSMAELMQHNIAPAMISSTPLDARPEHRSTP